MAKRNKKEYTWYVCDVENTGPSTQWHSTHWIGVVKLTKTLDTTFEGKMCARPETIDLDASPPRTGYHPESMQYTGGITFEEIQTWPHPSLIMPDLIRWVRATCEPGTIPLFQSDNTGHDKKWLDIYVDQYASEFYFDAEGNESSETPLGHSSQSLKDRFNGFKQGYKLATGHDVPSEYRSLEEMATTKHNHTPLDDAMGRAEALLKLSEFGYPIVVR